MIEYYYIAHYIVYRFYRIHKEDNLNSMIYACGVHFVLSFLFILEVNSYLCFFFDIQYHIHKPEGFGYLIFWAIFEYFIFFRRKRYLDIFNDFASQSGTPVMKKKFRNAKIFNTSVLIVEIILLFVSNYINRHK